MGTSVDDVLAHAGIYDPAARRERYLRTRQLKGRKKGQSDQGGDPNQRPTRQVAKSNHAAANQAASQARQIAAFRSRLVGLRAQLEKLLASAGAPTKTSTTPAKKTASSPVKNPLTSAEKAKAKVASQKYRDAHPTPKKDAASKTAATKEEQIKHLRALIADVESKLRAALEQARNQTA